MSSVFRCAWPDVSASPRACTRIRSRDDNVGSFTPRAQSGIARRDNLLLFRAIASCRDTGWGGPRPHPHDPPSALEARRESSGDTRRDPYICIYKYNNGYIIYSGRERYIVGGVKEEKGEKEKEREERRLSPE